MSTLCVCVCVCAHACTPVYVNVFMCGCVSDIMVFFDGGGGGGGGGLWVFLFF